MDSLISSTVDGLLGAVKAAAKKVLACKTSCKRLQKTLEGLIPTLNDVFHTGEDQLPEPLREFSEELNKGKKMVEECSNVHCLDLYELYLYSKKIDALEKYITEFTQRQGWAITYREVRRIGGRVENIEHITEEELPKITGRLDNLEHKAAESFRTEENFLKFIEKVTCPIENDKKASTILIPKLRIVHFGLEISIRDLKKRLMHKDDPLVGVVGMGGSGKTTLALAICNDVEVQEYFQKRIVFQTVGQAPNIMELLGSMWIKIVGKGKPEFSNIDHARRLLQEEISSMEPRPTLVVLDDVWAMSDLGKLMFEAEGYKTVITTRNNDIVISDQRYEKQLLGMSDAVRLFCRWAFRQESIPETADDKLVKEVIAKCNGLPLALEVIGRSLCERPPEAWMTAKHKLSQGQPVCDYHEEELLRRMATSVDILKEIVRECFLDMAIFSETRKISADPLLDLGVYVHGLKWDEAFTILIELEHRNLVKLFKNQKGTLWNSYGSSCELSFIQHDVLRELAFYLTEQEHLKNRCKRFLMPQKDDSSCKKASCPLDAQIVSFNTGQGSMEKDWCKIDFPNAKALILNFSATEYFLPPFMQSMHKLEVLMIFNHNAKRATLRGISVFSSLSRLKVVHLEGVIVPPLQQYCHSWKQLEKLSMILCEGFEDMAPLDINFPRLLELTVDHCINFKELPAGICQMTSLKRLSVTNCNELQKLSDDIEKLSSLERLRLYACPSLKELRNSICKLKKLQFLDISLCQCIKQLPDELGQLSSLNTLDMRECYHVKQLPRSARDLSSLKHVICDKKIHGQWSQIIGSSKVEVVEEYFNLDWL